MEPTETEIKFVAAVLKVEERFDHKWVRGIGPDAEFVDVSLGWYIHLQGSHEAIYIGRDKPKVRLGAIATIRISLPCQA